MPAENSAAICVDCRERDAGLDVRNRRLCAPCFTRYVNSKVLKRMESYRFKNLSGDQKRRLFLPISGGVSSLVLLQILDAQLQKQIASRNRTAYDLVVARVILPEEAHAITTEEHYSQLAQRFSTHDFLPLFALHDAIHVDSNIENDFRHLGMRRQTGESDAAFLGRLLSGTTSVTTRTDLQSIVLRRLLVSAAKEQNCESVIWGHSDSRLAALSLADVAKGRGGSVPSTIADGPSMHGINFNFPARDLFKAELETYAQAISDPLLERVLETEGAMRTPSTIRNTSIDDLLRYYITSQSEKYPSIMANVVRTASKLEPQNMVAKVAACSVCVMPIAGRHESINSDSMLCYGCERIKQEMKTELL